MSEHRTEQHVISQVHYSSLTAAGRTRWEVSCWCGWRSEPVSSRDKALELFYAHWRETR